MSSQLDYAAKEVSAKLALQVCVYLGCLPSDGVEGRQTNERKA